MIKTKQLILCLMLLALSPLDLLACGYSKERNKNDSLDTEEAVEEMMEGLSRMEDFEPSKITDIETEALAQGIDIGIKSITIPEYPRGDYIPFSNCPQDQVTKFEFRVENRGADFDKKGKGIFGAVQVKRLEDGALLLQEEAVLEFRAFTPGWVRFRFDPIDLSQVGLYEVTVESYLIDLSAYIKDKSLKPLDTDVSDNKVVYLSKVIAPASLSENSLQVFDFEGAQSEVDLAAQGWNYSYLPDSLLISNKGLGGSKAIEMHLHQGDKNKRKLFTPSMAMPEAAYLDFQFKLLDARSGKNVTEELISSEAFQAEISLQKICATGVEVTIKHKVSDALATADGFFKFPKVPVHRDPGNYREQIAFTNLSDYPEILLVIDEVRVQQ
ncbi:hypothetical protein [Echinicola strongylocentroti]|nr:hypothetical protein [Echinicola strongylocentroti]